MKKAIKFISLFLSLLLSVLIVGCNNQKEKSDEQGESTAMYKVTNYAIIKMENGGTIKIALYGEEAPITVANFVKLATEGFYDGLTFHRVMKGFMIQGGDPKGNGTGGSNENIIGEFTINGFNNPISHKRGVISMARSKSPNSASSQFFICHGDATRLDGQYAAFGEVVDGIDVIDDIAENTPVTYDMFGREKSSPMTPVIIKSITIEAP